MITARAYEFVATLFQKLPDLKLAIPFDEIKYSDPRKDIGIQDLSVVF
jgi:fungal nitric oxide reductase